MCWLKAGKKQKFKEKLRKVFFKLRSPSSPVISDCLFLNIKILFFQICSLVFHVMSKDFIIVKKDCYQEVLSASLNWETFEQVIFPTDMLQF